MNYKQNEKIIQVKESTLVVGIDAETQRRSIMTPLCG